MNNIAKGYSVIITNLNENIIYHKGNYPTKMAAIGKAIYSLSDLSIDDIKYFMSIYREDGSNGVIDLLRKTEGEVSKIATAYILPYYEYTDNSLEG